MNKKVLIIGGVAAGCKAASRIKRLDAEAEVTILEKGGIVSYGPLTLTDSTFTTNNVNGRGGAIFVGSGTANVSNITAVGNSAGLALENATMHRQMLEKQRMEITHDISLIRRDWDHAEPVLQVYADAEE